MSHLEPPGVMSSHLLIMTKVQVDRHTDISDTSVHLFSWRCPSLDSSRDVRMPNDFGCFMCHAYATHVPRMCICHAYACNIQDSCAQQGGGAAHMCMWRSVSVHMYVALCMWRIVERFNSAAAGSCPFVGRNAREP